jgi:hypothetical protein
MRGLVIDAVSELAFDVLPSRIIFAQMAGSIVGPLAPQAYSPLRTAQYKDGIEYLMR